MKVLRIIFMWLALYAVQATAQESSFQLWMDKTATMTADGETVTYITISQYDPNCNYIAFNMSLSIPKGVRINQVKSGREMIDDISSDRLANSHSLVALIPSADSRILNIACTSNANDELYPDDIDGNICYPLVTIGLVGDPTTINGVYDMVMSGISFTYRNKESGMLENIAMDKLGETCTLTVIGGTDPSSVQLTVGATGYATMYYSDCDLVVPVNVVATTYRVSDKKLIVSKTYEAGATIPASEGVVVAAEPGVYTFTASTATAVKDVDNMLKGTDENAMTEGDGLHYALALNAAGDIKSVGFYWLTADGQPFMNGAHKAYLVVPQGMEVLSAYRFGDDEATGVESVTTDSDSDIRYNVAGQMVDENYKSIIIKNGKKYLQK